MFLYIVFYNSQRQLLAKFGHSFDLPNRPPNLPKCCYRCGKTSIHEKCIVPHPENVPPKKNSKIASKMIPRIILVSSLGAPVVLLERKRVPVQSPKTLDVTLGGVHLKPLGLTFGPRKNDFRALMHPLFGMYSKQIEQIP